MAKFRLSDTTTFETSLAFVYIFATTLSKLDLPAGKLELTQGVKEAARIIYLAQQDNKDKEFELEMSWISNASGPTKGRHMEVPKELREEAERLAKKAVSDDEDDEDDDDEDEDDDDDEKMKG